MKIAGIAETSVANLRSAFPSGTSLAPDPAKGPVTKVYHTGFTGFNEPSRAVSCHLVGWISGPECSRPEAGRWICCNQICGWIWWGERGCARSPRMLLSGRWLKGLNIRRGADPQQPLDSASDPDHRTDATCPDEFSSGRGGSRPQQDPHPGVTRAVLNV